jgi:hypothetical protein
MSTERPQKYYPPRVIDQTTAWLLLRAVAKANGLQDQMVADMAFLHPERGQRWRERVVDFQRHSRSLRP